MCVLLWVHSHVAAWDGAVTRPLMKNSASFRREMEGVS